MLSSKYTPGERTSWDTTTRSVPLMMKVPFSVIIGKSPMKTVWLLISPVLLLMNSAVTNSGGRVRHVLVFALVDRSLDLVETRVGEAQRHRAREILDRRQLGENLFEATHRVDVATRLGDLTPARRADQPLERLRLDVEQAGYL